MPFVLNHLIWFDWIARYLCVCVRAIANGSEFHYPIALFTQCISIELNVIIVIIKDFFISSQPIYFGIERMNEKKMEKTSAIIEYIMRQMWNDDLQTQSDRNEQLRARISLRSLIAGNNRKFIVQFIKSNEIRTRRPLFLCSAASSSLSLAPLNYMIDQFIVSNGDDPMDSHKVQSEHMYMLSKSAVKMTNCTFYCNCKYISNKKPIFLFYFSSFVSLFLLLLLLFIWYTISSS